MSKHWKGLKNNLVEMFTRIQAVNMKTVMKPLRNSEETPRTQSLTISRNFQYRPKFLGPIHTPFCTKTERKTSVFVKVFTLIRTKTPKKRRFSKTLSRVDIRKNGGF